MRGLSFISAVASAVYIVSKKINILTPKDGIFTVVLKLRNSEMLQNSELQMYGPSNQGSVFGTPESRLKTHASHAQALLS